FEGWVLQHQSLVYSIALRITGQPTSAEDVAQEVFMKLYTTQEITDDQHVVSWLRRATVHRAIDSLRRTRTRAEEALTCEPTVLLDANDAIFANTRERLMSCLSPEAR